MARRMPAGGGRNRVCCAAAAAATLLALVVCAEAVTDSGETAALLAIRQSLTDPKESLNNWIGNDPCSSSAPWEGVLCETDRSGVSHVFELRLFQSELGGTLSSEVGNLPQLQTLNLMWNNITGGIPASVGELANLQLLLVNGNQMTGPLPPELGRLSKLVRLQIDQNGFSGAIPASFANLSSVRHLHMTNNFLSGQIPPGLGSLPNVIHILLDGNQLSGTIPSDLAATGSPLEILQLDDNPFEAGQQVPRDFTASTPHLIKLSMRNCNLAGTIPDLSGAPSLQFLDLSSNRLSGELPDMAALTNLTSFLLSSNSLSQNVSGLVLGPLPNLQALFLADNNFTGVVDVGKLLAGDAPRPASSFGEPGVIIDMQRNSLSSFIPVPDGIELWLAGNQAICGASDSSKYTQCTWRSEQLQDLEQGHQEEAPDCPGVPCDRMAAPKMINEVCSCLYPVSFRIRLRSPSFTLFRPLQARFVGYVAFGLTKSTNGTPSMTADQVGVRGYQWEEGARVVLDLQFFPAPKTTFSPKDVSNLLVAMTDWRVRPDPVFGPQEFVSWDAGWYVAGMRSQARSLSRRVGVAVGAVVGGVAGAVLVTAAVVWLASLLAYRYRASRAKRLGQRLVGDRTGDRDRSGLHVTGVREFTFEELCAATAMFGDERRVGEGGYGRVYRGEVPGLGTVAVKRAQEGSLQGSREFYTEIELLSRLHHRNLVQLLGFCDDRGEQMLVYEFMEGGTLKERLRRGELDLSSRIRIAIGSARGIAYLHNEAHAPIFHRDIKASNILLDARENAKVADLGLSRAAPAADPSHVSTVCKGTPGYVDPEYFLTHKLTDKSDVYSFGVVLLELATGQPPILQGLNIVRHVKAALEGGDFMDIVDPRMPMPAMAGTLMVESLARLGLRCCRDDPDSRPTMLEVVRDLEVMLPWTVSTDSLSPDSEPPTPSGPYSALAAEEAGSSRSVDHVVAPR